VQELAMLPQMRSKEINNMIESPVERLVKTNPDMEVWWDSSPLVYGSWERKMFDVAAPLQRPILQEQLERLLNLDDPAQSVVRGCTTNPPLSLQAVQDDPDTWNEWVDCLIRENPDATLQQLFWETYKEVVRRGAEMFMPMWQASNCRYGWISGQLDPRLATETNVMIRQAEELSALSPNVMIKVPATMEGVDVVKDLTSKAIATNVTTCFTLPQIIAVANAAREGKQLAEQNGVDMSGWRAVITFMMGRLTEREVIDIQAERRGLRFTRAEKHWYGIAVFKRAYRLLYEGAYPSKMLICSMRAGPYVNGKQRFWDIEETAGGNLVYTMPPYVLEPLFSIGDDLDFDPDAIYRDVPAHILDKFMKIPFCIQSYDSNGISLEQFNTQPSTVYTVEGFSNAAAGLESYVSERLKLSRSQSVRS
jgi:transaldolase